MKKEIVITSLKRYPEKNNYRFRRLMRLPSREEIIVCSLSGLRAQLNARAKMNQEDKKAITDRGLLMPVMVTINFPETMERVTLEES